MRKIILLCLVSVVVGIITITGVSQANAQGDVTAVQCGTKLIDQEISNSNNDDTYSIALNAGDTISIGLDVLGQGVEINVQLFDPSQTPLNIPVSQPGTPPLVRKVGATGDYTFVVSKYIGVSLYTLNIDCVLRNGTEIKAGEQEATAIPAASVTPTAVVQSVVLHVFAARESLTLFVSQVVSLNGLQFGTIVGNQLSLNSLTGRFDSLLLAGGMASANDCYVYAVEGATPPLSQSCNGQVFRNTIAAADVFWYDTVTNRPRDVAIFRDGQPTGVICSATVPDCVVNWIPNTPPTAIPQAPTLTDLPDISTANPTPLAPIVTSSPTNTLQSSSQPTNASGYPCPATIVDNTGSATILNAVHSEPVYASSPIASVRVGQAVLVLDKQLEGSRTVWYQIGTDANKIIGFMLEDYVQLSPSCPQ